MKRTALDKLVGIFSPRAELRRIQTRAATQMLLRAYDAAKDYRTSDWVSATKSGANAEIKAGQAKLRERARDLARNSPYGVQALNAITSNTVGAGIVANIRGKDETHTQKARDLWKLWAESTAIDAESQANFYGLQSLILRATAEGGDAVGLKTRTSETGPKVLVLEGDYIATAKDEGNIVQGVEFKDNVRTKYHLYQKHPGETGATEATKAYPASDVAHTYLRLRPGQVRGVPWSHAVIEPLKDLEDYQRATLISKKVSACFGGVIKTNGSDALLPADVLKERREAEMQMEPATFRYLNPGEELQLVTPPGVDGYDEFTRQTLRAVAAGYGISYEALTGDYSQSNYSSSRMGHIAFRRNIEVWRWHMLIPQFCEPVWRWFLEWAAVNGVNPEGLTVEWVPPAHTMIDPSKEVEALKREVRNGFKTWGQAVREQGLDPDTVLVEHAEWNKKFDQQKVSFDTDPRRMSQIGFAQAGDSLDKLGKVAYPKEEEASEGENSSEENNQEDASEEPDSGTGQ